MSEEESLLDLTTAHLNTGLRGVPVGTCRTSYVTPGEGVHYCGYPISELAMMSPEDIVYLLFHKELPTLEQSVEFRRDFCILKRKLQSVLLFLTLQTLMACS